MTPAELHPRTWFAERINVSRDYIDRHPSEFEHHNVGARVKYGECCVTDFLNRTRIPASQSNRRTEKSSAGKAA